MSKVFYDHQIFSMQRFGGISRYFANLYNRLSQESKITPELGLLYTKNHYLSDHNFAITDTVGKMLLSKEKRISKWNKWYSRYLVSQNNFDVFHPTYYHPYFLSKIKKPFVLTIHDMIHELLPEYFSYNDPFARYKRLVIEKASHFIAISESTKADLQSIYDIPNEKITVIHHGYIPSIGETEETTLSHDVNPESYILFVGERSGYKNFFRFISAMASVLAKYPEIKIICAGGGSFSNAESELFIRKKLTGRIRQVSISDEQLNLLYQNALLFVYPSLYEGFGLPLLEAFAKKCPVASSNTSCFQEVAGKAAIYFDPSDEADIQQAISSLIESKELRSSLKAAGELQLQKFSFEKCLINTREVYYNLVQ